jgi:hypothetical protein
MFVKYQHIERFGTDETRGIELGRCYIFPKIDGTNGCVWMENEELKCASRRRELIGDADNAGFKDYIIRQSNIVQFLIDNPELRLYGEWLVPHSLKTYRNNAWRKFYVFDVIHINNGKMYYLNYDVYKEYMDKYKIDYIPAQSIITNGSYEQFTNELEKNNFLIEDGKGCGEGIVIKNYDFSNKYGRIVWAKIVTSEFKEKHFKNMGASEIAGKKIIEEEIVNDLCTEALIQKTFEKMKQDKGGWKSQYIKELLGRIWHDFITEEAWNIIRKYKHPTINYRTLNHFLTIKIKATLTSLF